MKVVKFTFITNSQEKTEILVKDLKQKCESAGLELQNGRLFHYFRKCGDGDNADYRYDLQILKDKDHTYNQIYKLVNSVQIVSFTVV